MDHDPRTAERRPTTNRWDRLQPRVAAFLTRRWGSITAAGSDRGDVPGWVLVTLMTAGLVTALWLIAEPALGGVFEDALNSVTGGD